MVIPITNKGTSTKKNGNIDNRSNQKELSNVMPFKKLPPKSLRKMNIDAIIVKKEKYSSTRILRSSSKCSGGALSHITSKVISEDNLSKTALSAAAKFDTGSTKVSSTTHSEQTKNILALNSGDNKQTATKFVNIVPKCTAKSVTVENYGINLHPRRCKLKTGCSTSATNVAVVDTTNKPISFTNNYQMHLDIRQQVIKLCI